VRLTDKNVGDTHTGGATPPGRAPVRWWPAPRQATP
jgi:hypothetical protein